ncbi:hypothetical protein GCM10025885_17040 [Tetragenococcus osmophilus]|uniref:Uncharacterized protein n=1 Tax=Tetragenococcus osmophilus TaxID=526944 RepID=A0AA38CYY2_9ENTE|nr:hypothetical protein GCM10025885_17040 [Tetragenococcus osmophilus]
MRKWKLWQKVVGIVLISLLMIFGAAAFYLKQNTYTATSAAQKKANKPYMKKITTSIRMQERINLVLFFIREH